MNILVACVGNIFEGDDAFGCEVARALRGRLNLPNVRLVDFGVRGFDLVSALLNGPDLTILVDTFARGGTPGSLYLVEPEISEQPSATPFTFNGHSLDPQSALQAVKGFGGTLKRVLLVGCEPQTFGGASGFIGLTPLVQRAVPAAARLVELVISKEIHRA